MHSCWEGEADVCDEVHIGFDNWELTQHLPVSGRYDRVEDGDWTQEVFVSLLIDVGTEGVRYSVDTPFEVSCK